MQAIYLYAVSAVIFLAADAVMLRAVIKPVFQKHLGDWLMDPIRFGPAVAFYLAYVAGLVWLVSLPALAAGKPGLALVNGAIMGAMAYGTYEFTNLSTLTRWSWQQVALDLTWGTVLTGVSAWAGVKIVMWLT
jgi:uncharacterized membrane protein